MIYIRQKTKQIMTLIAQKAQHCEKIKRQQAETFTSLVNHEICSPINSTLICVSLILDLVHKFENLPLAFVSDLKVYTNCMTSHLSLSMSFVQDMLDIDHMVVGSLYLNNEVFNPQNALDAINVIFQPLAQKKGIILTVKTESFLRPPDFAGETQQENGYAVK